MIGIGIWTFVVYIGFVIVWNVVIKRSITEAMALALLVACAFSGTDFFPVLKDSLISAFSSNVILAIMLFTFMSNIVTATGIIGRLVNILNSLLGRIRGGLRTGHSDDALFAPYDLAGGALRHACRHGRDAGMVCGGFEPLHV